MLEHLTEYPDSIIIGKNYKRPKLFEKFKPDLITFTTKCEHSVYLESLIFAADILLTWKKTEEKIMSKLNQDLSEQAFINYLDTLSIQYFFSPIGLSTFESIVEKEFISGILPRFIELQSQLNTLIDPTALSAIKGRMIHYLLTSNDELAKSQYMVPVYRDGKRALIVQNTTIFDVIYKYPWIWMLPFYRTFELYSEMMSLKAAIK